MSGEKHKTHTEPTGYDSGLPVYPSIAACSGATGIPLAVLKSAKKDGCSGFKASRVYLAEVLPFIFQREDGDGTNWGEAFKEAQAKRERIKLSKDERSVVDREQVREGVAAGMAVTFGELDRVFCSEFPAVVKGMDEVQIRARAQAEIAKLKSALRLKFEAAVEEEKGDA